MRRIYLGFEITEKRKQSEHSPFCRTVGYAAHYKAWPSKGRSEVLIEAKTLREVKAAVKAQWAAWSVSEQVAQ